MKNYQLVSFHGCHSGEFCNHAEDNLEEMVKKYVRLGFEKIGITDHIPPYNDQYRYLDEKQAKMSAKFLLQRFTKYCKKVRFLQKKYSSDIKIFFGFETESYTGYTKHVKKLIKDFQPDYIVGSIHHVQDICFDYSPSDYESAVNKCGSIDALYKQYFDRQYEMISKLEPAVVGHFDIIRIHDPDYKRRFLKPEIMDKIIRNLKKIKEHDLILDFNLRPFAKGENEPYITQNILEIIHKMNLKITPGEDSHGLADIGTFIHQGIEILKNNGFSTDWPEPKIYEYKENLR